MSSAAERKAQKEAYLKNLASQKNSAPAPAPVRKLLPVAAAQTDGSPDGATSARDRKWEMQRQKFAKQGDVPSSSGGRNSNSNNSNSGGGNLNMERGGSQPQRPSSSSRGVGAPQEPDSAYYDVPPSRLPDPRQQSPPKRDVAERGGGSDEPVNLKNWAREGYPSEYAYAQATGGMNIKPRSKPQPQSYPTVSPQQTPPQSQRPTSGRGRDVISNANANVNDSSYGNNNSHLDHQSHAHEQIQEPANAGRGRASASPQTHHMSNTQDIQNMHNMHNKQASPIQNPASPAPASPAPISGGGGGSYTNNSNSNNSNSNNSHNNGSSSLLSPRINGIQNIGGAPTGNSPSVAKSRQEEYARQLQAQMTFKNEQTTAASPNLRMSVEMGVGTNAIGGGGVERSKVRDV